MKPDRSQVIAFVMAAIFPMLSIGSAFAAGEVLKTGDVSTISQWYGRAGGLVGSDRVEAITKSAPAGERVGITYDRDVAARTNMPRDGAGSGDVGITYDKDVAARTNMPRGEKFEPPITATGTTDKGHN